MNNNLYNNQYYPHRRKDNGNETFIKVIVAIVILTLAVFVAGTTFVAGFLIASGKTNITKEITAVPSENITVNEVQSVINDVEKGSTIREIAKLVSPAIVTINTVSSSDSLLGYEEFFGGSGSGIVFKADNKEVLIVTNYHVIEGSEEEVEIVFPDESKLTGKVLGYNSINDIAVISVPLSEVKDTIGEITVAKLGDSSSVEVGDIAVAIGNPLGEEYSSTVTAGIISALGRNINLENNTVQVNLIQTDAAINPGNSGGALLNNKGEVIGINSAKYVSEDVEGIGFAIPINDAQENIDRILEDRSGTDLAYELEDDRAFLGVKIQDITPEINSKTGMTFGVYVNEVYDGSGAKEAGIEKGDIIYGIDGSKIRNTNELFSALSDAEVGDIIEIDVARDDEILTVEATLYSYKEVMEQN